MNADPHKKILNSATFGYAYHQIIVANDGIPYDYRFLEVNEAFAKICGLKPEEITGKTAREIFPDIEAKTLVQIGKFSKIALNKGNEAFEFYNENNGNWYKAQVHSPEPGYFATFYIDITHEKIILEGFEGLFLANTEPMCIADFAGNFIKVNQAWEKILGYKVNELEGKKFLDFVHPDDLQATLAAITRLTGQETLLNFTNRYRCLDGSYRTIRWCSRPHGKLIFAAAEDITDEDRIKNDLYEKQAELEAIYDNSPVMMCVLDEQQKVVYANKLFLNFIGRSLDEIKKFRAGGAIGCKNATENLSGCGYGTSCQNCELNMGMLDTMINGSGHQNVPFNASLMVNGKLKEICLLANFSRINIPGKKYMSLVFQDISERNSIEKALRESEERFRLIALYTHDLEYWQNENGQIVYISPSCERITGYRPEEFYEDNELLHKIIHPDDLELFNSHKNQPCAIGHRKPLDFRIITRQKTVEWINHVCRIVYDSGGKFAGIRGCNRIITESKSTQIALQKSEKMLQTVFGSANVGISLVDASGKFTLLNRWWKEKLGYDEEELNKSSYNEITCEEDLSMSRLYMNKLQRGELDSYNIEKRYRKKDGSIFWGNLSVSVVRDGNNDVLNYIGVVVDITDKKAAVEALKKSKEQFELAVRGSNDGIWDWNLVTNELFLSARWKEQLGFSDEELPNVFATFENLIAEDDKPRVMEFIGKYLNGETQNYDLNLRMLHKDNHYRWMRSRGAAIRNSEGKPIRMAGSHTDMTEHELAAKALAAAKEQAEAASRSKSEFLANMSHEIRTPLNGVIGFTDLLLQSRLDETQKKFVNNANACGKALLAVIKNILDFSKIEVGKLELESIETDILELLQQVTDIMNYQVNQKGLELKLDIPPTMANIAVLDPDRLKQILINLLSNAVKFTEKGEVELKVRFEPIANGRGCYTFLVRDTGIGISEEQQKNLFKAFSQADTSITRKFGGTGLGLAISNLLAQKMDSHIEVESSYGKGSVFYFTIEACCKTEKREYLQEPFSSPTLPSLDQKSLITNQKGRPARILIAEDISSNMLLARTLIARLLPNVEIIEAANGREAVQAVKNHKIDLILMDINMPVLDGRDATNQIREYEKEANTRVPIVAFTASALKEEMEKCMAVGMDDFLTKPVTSAAMAKVLEKFLTECYCETPYLEEKASMETSKSFDKAAFIEQIGNDDTLKKELFKRFRNDAISRIKIIEAGIESQSKEKVKKAAHAIKGASLSMAFNELAKLAENLENCAEKDEILTKKALEKLKTEWQSVNQIIDAELANLG